MIIFRALIFSFLSVGLAGHVQATLLWDEATNGDLPNILRADQLSPNLVLHEGVNEIRGTSSWSGIFLQGQYQGASDADRARLTLLPGLQIDIIDYVFSNVSLLQLSGPLSPGVRLRQGYALTEDDTRSRIYCFINSGIFRTSSVKRCQFRLVRLMYCLLSSLVTITCLVPGLEAQASQRNGITPGTTPPRLR
ncbi:MAG: hypothetical protein IPG06_07360 [Haliea sp.]|nr:hypothetical protein [Haliea sp.]